MGSRSRATVSKDGSRGFSAQQQNDAGIEQETEAANAQSPAEPVVGETQRRLVADMRGATASSQASVTLPPSATARTLYNLHQTVGNQVVSRWISGNLGKAATHSETASDRDEEDEREVEDGEATPASEIGSDNASGEPTPPAGGNPPPPPADEPPPAAPINRLFSATQTTPAGGAVQRDGDDTGSSTSTATPTTPPATTTPDGGTPQTFNLNFEAHMVPPYHLQNVPEEIVLRALHNIWRTLTNLVQVGHESVDDLRRLHEDQFIVAWISDHLSGSELPTQAVWNPAQRALDEARGTLDAQDINATVQSLRRAADAYADGQHALSEYREGTVTGAERAVTVLEVTEVAGAVAATVATGGLAGEGLLATSAVAGATGGIYGMAQEGAGQASELAEGLRHEFDVAGLLRRGLTDAVTGFVGAFAGGALSRYMSRFFGSYLAEASPQLLEELGRLEGLAGPLPRDYFMTTGQRLIVDFLSNTATTPLTAAITTVIQQATGSSRPPPTAEQFARDVFHQMVEGGIMTLFVGSLRAHFSGSGANGATAGEETPAGHETESAAHPEVSDSGAGTGETPTGETSESTSAPDSPHPESPASTGRDTIPDGVATERTSAISDELISDLPDETVMRSANPRSAADAHQMYNNCINESPTREAAVYRNTETGEFIVVQGNERMASVGRGPTGEPEAPHGATRPGQQAQRWKEILDAGSDVGRWELEMHYHPVDPATGVVDPAAHFPSGAGGDFGVLFAESRAAGGQPRSSRIHFRTGEGESFTDFSYDPNAPRPYHIDYPGTGGQRQQLDFATVGEYHEWFRQTFGGDLGAIPDHMAQADARTTTVPDRGLATEPDGTITESDATTTEADATTTQPRGDTTEVDGATTEPDATTTEPDGTRTEADGPPAATTAGAGEGGNFEHLDPQRYRMLGEPDSGTSESYRLEDTQTGERYLFKPSAGDAAVSRAQARGIRQGSYARRAAAAEVVAGEAGLATPEVRLVELGGRRGSLQRWVDQGRTLSDIFLNDRPLYDRVTSSAEYQRMRADLDTFDYLINNLDRNMGNLIVDLGPNGEVRRLIPIDQDLTFPPTDVRPIMPGWTSGLPEHYSRAMYDRLQRMSENRPALRNALSMFLQPNEIDATFQRLDAILRDIEQKLATRGPAGTFDG